MRTQRAFTIIELLVVIAIIAVLIGLIFPAIGAIKRNAKQTENNVAVRGIIQSMITYSESRRSFFPGFDGFQFDDNSAKVTGVSSRGQNPEARYFVMLDQNYTTADAIISPAEEKDQWVRDEVSTDNYSFAMLDLASNPVSVTALDSANAYRREEWRNQQNPLAPLVTDRLAENGSTIVPIQGNPDTYLSIHDGSEEGKWIGSIGYGDLSVDFEKTSEVETRFADQRNEVDDIFFQNDVAGAGLVPEKNASMTFRSVGQPLGIIE